MDCNNCKEKRAEPVSYIVFESTKATMERTSKRLWIVVIVLISLLFFSNAAWLYYESQFKTEKTAEITQDVNTDNGYAYVAGIGDVSYGESKANN